MPTSMQLELDTNPFLRPHAETLRAYLGVPESESDEATPTSPASSRSCGTQTLGVAQRPSERHQQQHLQDQARRPETWVFAVSPMAKRAGIILDGPIVEKLRFLRMGKTVKQGVCWRSVGGLWQSYLHGFSICNYFV